MLAVEQPLEIRVGHGRTDARDSEPVALTMRTPGHEAELALGYLYNEGVISSIANVLSCSVADSSNSVRIELHPDIRFDSEALRRYSFVSSACGACGKQDLRTADRGRADKSGRRLSAHVLEALPSALRKAQSTFDQTGGLHAAALFTFDGQLVLLREDIGRHNAVDKATGAALLSGTELKDKVLLLSGRAGYELVQKAVASGIPVLAAIGAPSSLAVETADQFDITLAGFLRQNRFNIYTAPWRIEAVDMLTNACEYEGITEEGGGPV